MSLFRRLSFLPLKSLRPALCFLVLAATLGAGGLALPSASDARELPYSQGILWRVERDGELPSYLFGTIHVADERVLDLPPEVQSVFEESQSATFEIILDDATRLYLAKASLLTDGRTLDQVIGAELFGKVAAAGAEYGMPGQALKMFKAWALIPIFSLPPDQFALIAAGKSPLDEWLQLEAGRNGKKVYALETVEEQLSLFEDLSEQDQIAMLASLLDDVAESRGSFRDMVRHYLNRDLAAIHNQMVEQASGQTQRLAEDFEEDFIVARNQRMVERLDDILLEGGSFIAVGALHLPGEEGMLNLLAERGYDITLLY